MVLIVQSNTNEDSQGRQLRVSKKLSKVISSVPRSRFQKPRPNLPGSKRSESAVSTAVTKRNESSVKRDTIGNSLILNTDESSVKGDTIQNTVTLNADETSNSDCYSDTGKRLENLNTDEICQINDSLQTSEVLNVDGEFPDKGTVEPVEHINVDEASQNNVKISENVHVDETSHSNNTPNFVTVDIESDQDLVEETPALISNDSTDVSPITTVNSTDKSSKYPHLTSILSKKRAEPKKEVQHKKRKKFKKGDAAPERSKMTMADLIYWNPSNTDVPPKSVATEDEIPPNENIDEPEECPDADAPPEENTVHDSVPKLVISEDGSINIDQSSLVVSRNIPEPTITEVIRKDDTTYSSFRKRPMTKHWTAKDTTIFYKALSLVGTDFGLMEKIFPHRSRRELKLKFKREEKFNIDLINRAMYESHLTFDANTLGDLIKNLNDLTGDFSSENVQEDAQCSNKEKKKPGKRKLKVKKSVESDDIDFIDSVSESAPIEAPNGDKVRSKRRRKARKLPDGFVDSHEIDEILMEEEAPKETNCNDAVCEMEAIAEENQSKDDECQTLVPNSELDEICDTTNIEILCIENVLDVDMNTDVQGSNAIFFPENTSNLSQVITIQDGSSDHVTQTISFANDNKQEQCITLEYVEDVNQTADLSLLNNVMAFEVVASNMPLPKRRRKVNFTPNIPKTEKFKKSCQPCHISSTNYTPV